MTKFFSSFFLSFPRYFSLLFAVFFLVSFFALYESFRAYRAEAELVVLPRGSSVSVETVTATLAHIPSTLSFYDRLREDHENISDPWEGESAANRKRSWGSVIAASSVPESGLIRLSVSSDDSMQSAALLNASIETLYGFSGRLYNRDTQADVRLVEEGIVYPIVTRMWLLLLISAACAAFGALLVSSLAQRVAPFFFFFSFSNMVSFRRGTLLSDTGNANMIRPVGSFPDIVGEPSPTERIQVEHDREETVPRTSMPENAEKEENISEEKKENGFSAELPREPYRAGEYSDEPQDIWDKSRFVFEKPKSPERAMPVISPAQAPDKAIRTEVPSQLESGVPGNLPTVPAKDFTWEKLLFRDGVVEAETSEGNGEKDDEKQGVDSSVSGTTPMTRVSENREPTPEELKARLNQLLRGES